MPGRKGFAAAEACGLGMGSELSDRERAVLRALGRAWDRIVWSGLVLVAIAADLWFALFPSAYPWTPFLLGLFTGIAFSGFAFTRARR